MKYTIIQILEDDYGCEGIPDGEEPMCSVLVKDNDGSERFLRIADSWLTENKLECGSVFDWGE